jgi:hypothetical protein
MIHYRPVMWVQRSRVPDISPNWETVLSMGLAVLCPGVLGLIVPVGKKTNWPHLESKSIGYVVVSSSSVHLKFQDLPPVMIEKIGEKIGRKIRVVGAGHQMSKLSVCRALFESSQGIKMLTVWQTLIEQRTPLFFLGCLFVR